VLLFRVGFDAGFGLVEAVDKGVQRLQEGFDQRRLIAIPIRFA
jgi:hypothetical protein